MVNVQLFFISMLCLGVVACAATDLSEPDLSHDATEKKISSPSIIVEPDKSAVVAESVGETASLKNKSAKVKVDVAIVGNARDRESVVDAMTTVSDIYEQCQIQLETTVRELPNENAINVDSSQRYALTNKFADITDDQETTPTVFVIGSTAERSVVFGYLPSLRRDVSNTAWVSDRVSKRCLAWIVGH